LLPDQQVMLDQIKTADAASVDTVYLGHQQTAHEAALALHQGYAETGDTPALKMAATEIASVVKMHIGHLSDVQTQ
jgi:putative membrane protein